jgi:hypothetical protein
MDFLTQPVDLWVLIVAGIVIVGLVVYLVNAIAPEGFEDGEGFHTYQDAYESAKQFSSDLAGKLYNRLTEIEKLESEIELLKEVTDQYGIVLSENAALRLQVETQSNGLEQIRKMCEKETEEILSHKYDPPKIVHEGKPLPEASAASEKILPSRKATQTEEGRLKIGHRR